MFKKILLLLAASFVTRAATAKEYLPIKKGPLSGTVVVVDPGHGGQDPGCHWVEQWGKRKVTFYEAAYTYPAAWSFAYLLRQQGAIVYLTAHSKIMGQQVSAQSSMPLPRDARYSTGKPVMGTADLKVRRQIAWYVHQRWYGKKKLFFISLHVDSMPHPQLWSGSHVCVDWHAYEIPRLAIILSRYLTDKGYERLYKKKPYHVIQPRGLLILNNNVIRQRILVEMGIPGNKADSWRLRNTHNRNLYLGTIVKAVTYTAHHWPKKPAPKKGQTVKSRFYGS